VLVIHRGLSGPAILTISNYWRSTESLVVDIIPRRDLLPELSHPANGKKNPCTLLSKYLPRRFASAWCQYERLTRPCGEYSPRRTAAISHRLHNWEIRPSKTQGYKTAEVTVGGISTDAISSKTMECRTVPGLFFVGEVLDVTGELGGFNLHWAWASGWCAGQVV
ncbi:MAG: aminoacetone oxidase family FAD-binding enzyme, partial [Chitinivibrionales bacterium]|nr:aminoacetone oxidase family FAD-binding enzyme [Chitinivibrionales bacterium]MBD3357643.1 aminoacetone oxidase family FAD-binding enzyme [Chitinivibrionales bacterium]